jgi:hypothetical protein
MLRGMEFYHAGLGAQVRCAVDVHAVHAQLVGWVVLKEWRWDLNPGHVCKVVWSAPDHLAF